jgi:AraC-like DNA-binding protein
MSAVGGSLTAKAVTPSNAFCDASRHELQRPQSLASCGEPSPVPVTASAEPAYGVPVPNPLQAVRGAPEKLTLSTAQFLASAREEFAWLANTLGTLSCSALIRSSVGEVLAWVLADAGTDGSASNEQPMLSAPIYDIQGHPLASLELWAKGVANSDLAQKLLASIARSLSESITERWFRICHLRHTIIAAQQSGDPERRLLLAVDQRFQIVGADRWARLLLQSKNLHLRSPLILSALFRFCPDELPRGRGYERAITLLAADDGTPWLALATSPDLSASQLGYSNRVLLHSRPRLGLMPSLGDASGHGGAGGLARTALRRIDAFVDARLDSRISVADIATSVGLSTSRFFRVFRKSFGVTPHAYVMRRRLVLAEELLRKTDMGVAEIALRAGFSDQSHFSRCFRRSTGVPPQRFRRQHRYAE